MLITIDVSAYYDWKPTTRTPTEAEIAALKVKPDGAGRWLERVLVEAETHATVNLPESEIADCIAHFTRLDITKTRAQIVAWYLSEKVMPHHAHQEHWTGIQVHDEPEVEKYLNNEFCLAEVA